MTPKNMAENPITPFVLTDPECMMDALREAWNCSPVVADAMLSLQGTPNEHGLPTRVEDMINGELTDLLCKLKLDGGDVERLLTRCVQKTAALKQPVRNWRAWLRASAVGFAIASGKPVDEHEHDKPEQARGGRRRGRRGSRRSGGGLLKEAYEYGAATITQMLVAGDLEGIDCAGAFATGFMDAMSATRVVDTPGRRELTRSHGYSMAVALKGREVPAAPAWLRMVCAQHRGVLDRCAGIQAPAPATEVDAPEGDADA
jgi:hypothetical protein